MADHRENAVNLCNFLSRSLGKSVNLVTFGAGHWENAVNLVIFGVDLRENVMNLDICGAGHWEDAMNLVILEQITRKRKEISEFWSRSLGKTL